MVNIKLSGKHETHHYLVTAAQSPWKRKKKQRLVKQLFNKAAVYLVGIYTPEIYRLRTVQTPHSNPSKCVVF